MRGRAAGGGAGDGEVDVSTAGQDCRRDRRRRRDELLVGLTCRLSVNKLRHSDRLGQSWRGVARGGAWRRAKACRGKRGRRKSRRFVAAGSLQREWLGVR